MTRKKNLVPTGMASRLEVSLRQAKPPVSVSALVRATGYCDRVVRDRLRGHIQAGPIEVRDAIVAAALAQGVRVEGDPWEMVPNPTPWGATPTRKTGTLKSPQPNHHTVLDGREESEMIPTRTYLEPEDLKAFGMATDPFDDLAPDRAWVSARGQSMERAVRRAIERREIIAVTGEPGTGKSTLLRRMHLQMSDFLARVLWMSPGNLDRAQISEGSLATAMLRDLDVGDMAAGSAERRGDRLRAELERRAQEGDYPVLCIDEAHDLSVTGLIGIKRIWDSFSFNRSLAVILAGQPQLARVLRGDPRVREVTLRTRLIEIPPLTVDDVAAYLEHRFAASGSGVRADQVFEPAALQMLVQRGATSPLMVDALAGACLQRARFMASRKITASIAAKA